MEAWGLEFSFFFSFSQIYSLTLISSSFPKVLSVPLKIKWIWGTWKRRLSPMPERCSESQEMMLVDQEKTTGQISAKKKNV